MQLDKEAIKEFKNLYFQEYGIRLSDIQAAELGTKLIRLVKAVYGNNLPPLQVDRKAKKGNN